MNLYTAIFGVKYPKNIYTPYVLRIATQLKTKG